MQATRQIRHPELTRQRLLEAAHREIYLHGFQGASLERILSETGLSKGALYHHFSAKKALGIAVVEEVIGERLRREWIEPLEHAAKPVDALLQIIARKQADADAESIRLGCDLNNLIQEMSPLDEAFRHSLANLIKRWRKSMETALARAQTKGEIRPEIDCARTALFLVSAIEGCTGLSKNQRSIEDYRGCLDGVKDYLQALRVN